MDLLREFFDPIPLAAMIAVAFAFIVIFVLAWIFRMPSDFEFKERFRAEVRSRLVSDRMAEKLIEETVEAKKLAAAEEQNATASEPLSAEPAADPSAT